MDDFVKTNKTIDVQLHLLQQVILPRYFGNIVELFNSERTSCPGLVETPMIREEAGEEKLNYWLSQIPLGRFSTPEEEADLVLFLASKQSKYITGATIDFNGGSLLI